MNDSSLPWAQSMPLYLPLVEHQVIRLFNVKPGKPQDPLSLELFIVELRHHPHFEALSYVWGDSSDDIRVTCNDTSMPVKVNLHDALKRIRYPDKNRTLWADAICINQGSTKERSHHVSFMRLIYEAADRVLIDVGPDLHGSAVLVVSLLQQTRHFIAQDDSTLKIQSLRSDDPLVEDNRWHGVAALLQRPWFSRAWVLQEAGSAKTATVVYGDVQFDYRKFVGLVKWVVTYASQIDARFELDWWNIHLDWADWSKPPNNQSARDILIFLLQARVLRCHDSRDHVYAFLGHPFMTDIHGHMLIKADYTKDSGTVFRDLAVELTSLGVTRVMSAVEHDNASILEGVSWVPRWDIDLVTADFGVLPENWYRFSGAMEESSVSFNIRNNQLELEGVIFDRIVKVFQFPLRSSERCRDIELPSFKDLQSSKLSHAEGYPFLLDQILVQLCTSSIQLDPSDSIIDIFSQTLCAARTTEAYKPVDKNLNQHRADFNAYWRLRQKGLDIEAMKEDIVGDSQSDGNAEQFSFDFRRSCEARTFMITERGFVGLGPWVLKQGDVCSFIPGSKVPFMFRPCSIMTSGVQHRQFRLLGDAYLHGMMRGEVHALVRDEELAVEPFIIL